MNWIHFLKKSFIFASFLCFLLIQACSKEQDSFLWLEDVEGDRALSWVKQQNKEALNQLTRTKRFRQTQQQILNTLESKDKIPRVSFHNHIVYNFWQDASHVRGILRKSSLKNYLQKQPKWEVILDIDQLAKTEKEDWVYKGMRCLREKKQRRHCLLYLSRGGKDANVIREFDLVSKEFVKNGFNLPEAKGKISWIDKDTVFVATDFGKESLTTSGYPRMVKIWKRSESFKKTKTIFKANQKDVGARASVLHSPNDQVSIIRRAKTYYKSDIFVYEKGSLKKLPIPKTANLQGFFQGFFIVYLTKDWKVNGQKFKEGSLIAVNKKSAGSSIKGHIQLIFEPSGGVWFQNYNLSMTEDKILIGVLKNVRSQIFQISFLDKEKKFSRPKPLKGLDKNGNFYLSATSLDSSDFFIYRGDFLEPYTQFFYKNQTSLI